MERRDFLRGVGTGLAAGGTALLSGACGAPSEPGEAEPAEDDSPAQQDAASQPRIEWRMATSWTTSLDVLYGAAETMAARVAAMTGGQFSITVLPAGEPVGALDVFDAVQDGTVECCHTVAFYFIDKNEAFGIATGLPFGFTSQQQNAWLYHGGGMEAVQTVFDDFGIIHFPAGNTGTQMGGWIKHEINSLNDMKNITFRIPGLGGNIMQRLGVQTVVLPASDVAQALESGEIDAAEWVGPYDDEKLELHKAAPFYYYPGWWEPGTTVSLMINRHAWDALPAEYQDCLQSAAHQANISTLSRYETLNQEALARLVAEGTQLRPYNEEILRAAKTVAFEFYEETALNNTSFRELYEPWKTFRRHIYQWHRFNELSFATFATEHVL
jgi:TRAP-type mannitol/chloroaromatic compound transport system substrate-binding protein